MPSQASLNVITNTGANLMNMEYLGGWNSLTMDIRPSVLVVSKYKNRIICLSIVRFNISIEKCLPAITYPPNITH
jgi:hypothetical protein